MAKNERFDNLSKLQIKLSTVYFADSVLKVGKDQSNFDRCSLFYRQRNDSVTRKVTYCKTFQFNYKHL